MDKWSKEIKIRIKAKLEGVRERDLKFFRIDEFVRNIERTEQYSPKCPQCAKNKIEIGVNIEKIDEAIKVPGPVRREYDRLISRISNHLLKEHGFYPPFHFTYLYSFVGMVAGLATGYALMKIFPQTDWIPLITGVAVGLIGGQVWGSMKDKKIRKEKKIM